MRKSRAAAPTRQGARLTDGPGPGEHPHACRPPVTASSPMDPSGLSPHLPLAVHALLTASLVLVLTPLARRLALHLGVMDVPGRRKLHRAPVPYLGGVAVVGGMALVWLALQAGLLRDPTLGGDPAVAALMAAAVAMMVLGLVDDVRGLSPLARLAGQVVIVAAFLTVVDVFDEVRLGGLVFEDLPAGVGFGLAAFWILSMTNAANLMDGMDGLAAGVGVVAVSFLAYLALAVYGQAAMAETLVLAAGAYGAFLVFNRHPARIYLGDAGSLALGFLLGAGALGATTSGGRWDLAPALLVLGVPAADLFLAVLRRGLSSVGIQRGDGDGFVFRMVRRPRFFEGDRGHLHHRLLERTGSIRRAVWTLYAAGAVTGLLGIWAARDPGLAPMLLVGSVLLGLMAVSRFLHPELRIFEQGFLLPLFHAPVVGRRHLHVTFDALVFAGAFLFAGWMVTRWWPAGWLDVARLALAGLTGAATLGALGLYRIRFRRAGLWSLWRAASSVGAAAAVVLLVDTLVVRQPLASASGVLFVFLVFTGCLGPRAAYGFIEAAYARRRRQGRRTLVYGGGPSEIAFLQRLLATGSLGLNPVGVLSEDPTLDGAMVHGVPAYHARGPALSPLLRKLSIEAVVLLGDPRPGVEETRLYLELRAAGVSLLRYRESLSDAVPVPRRADPPGDSATDLIPHRSQR